MELQINIVLAPSCQHCTVSINVQPPPSSSSQPLRLLPPRRHSKRIHDDTTITTTTSESGPIDTSRRPNKKRMICTSSSNDDDNDTNGATHNAALLVAVVPSQSLDETAATSPASLSSDDSQQDCDPSSSSDYEPSPEYSHDKDDDDDYADESDSSQHGIHNTTTKSEGRTRTSRMSVSEIQQCLSKALPQIVNDTNDQSIANHYLTAPIGNVLEEYTAPVIGTTTRDTTADFCVTLAKGSDPVVREYHHQVQNLAIWFIETAENVNIASTDNGGYWKVLYLFQKHVRPVRLLSSRRQSPRKEQTAASSKTTVVYSLAGYMTLFFFPSPFRKPCPGTVVRVCQALILPPYQRAGHGRRLLQSVYDHVVLENGTATTSSKSLGLSMRTKNDDPIVELNVEDPAPAFVALRNRVDYERLLHFQSKAKDSSLDVPTILTSFQDMQVDHKDYFVPPKEDDIVALASFLKVTPKQARIVCEMTKLRTMQVSTENHHHDNAQADDHLAKQFRLMVKKRLNKEHREDLSACRNKQEMQQHLSTLFDELHDHYIRILKSVHHE